MPSGVYPRQKKPLPARRTHHLDRRAGALLNSEQASGDADYLLTTTEVSEWLGMSTQFLTIGRHRGFGPPFVTLSARMVRYRRGAIREWLEQRQHHSTAQRDAALRVRAS
jgi:predicted DNA-binding transcriptional regulator AlpA